MVVAYSGRSIDVFLVTQTLGAPRENEPNAHRVTIKDRPGHEPRYELHGMEKPFGPMRTHCDLT